MLELRPNCELCDCDLPADCDQARICSYECTFCASCVDDVLHNVCPNCGGGFVSRPIRPKMARRDGVSRAHQKPSDQRKVAKFTRQQMVFFAAAHKAVPPAQR